MWLRAVFEHRYLSKAVLKGFDNYKYSCKDTSPFSIYVMHPFWDATVKLFPLWLAPNVMTLAGYLLLVLMFFVLSYYDPDFTASSDAVPRTSPLPNWIWIFGALCNFWSHTLDGIDGKQARRTKSSSPLGELFDHGVDSWSTMFLPISLYSIFGREDHGVPIFRFFLVLLAIQFVFIMSHFEKYNTGVLFLPWGYDIALVAMSAVYLLTYFLGYQYWKVTLPVFEVSQTILFEVAVYGGSLGLSCPMTAFNIYNAYKSGHGKRSSLYEATLPLFSVTVLFISLLLWAWLSPADVLGAQPRWFCWLTGTLFSNIACRLIVSQMSGTRCEPFNPLVIPVILITLTVALVPAAIIARLEIPFLIGYAMVVTILHLHYGCSVVREMASHFKIRVFSIPQRND